MIEKDVVHLYKGQVGLYPALFLSSLLYNSYKGRTKGLLTVLFLLMLILVLPFSFALPEPVGVWDFADDWLADKVNDNDMNMNDLFNDNITFKNEPSVNYSIPQAGKYLYTDTYTSGVLHLASGDAYTICGWFRIADEAGGQTAFLEIFNGVIEGSDYSVSFILSGDKNTHYLITNNGGSNGYRTISTSMAVETWYHYCIQQDYTNQTVRVVRNGADMGGSDSGTYPTAPSSSTQAFTIGYDGASSGTTSWYGNIDEVYFFDSWLSIDDMQELYNSGDGLFYPFTTPAHDIEPLFLDRDNRSNIYDVIAEDDHFFWGANYTYDGAVIDDAVCYQTAANISSHFDNRSNDDYQLNTTSDYIFTVMADTASDVFNDRIIFDVCRGSINNDLDVYINGGLFKTVTSAVIPPCTAGFHEEDFITSAYDNISTYNVTLRCADCSPSANSFMRILSGEDHDRLEVERKYYHHTHNLTYNSTSSLYEFNGHVYRFAFSGENATFNITCNANQSNFSIEIADAAILINITSFNDEPFISGGEYEINESNNIIASFAGDITTGVEFNLSDENLTIIKQGNNENLTVSGSELDYSGLYYINISATDDEGNVYYENASFIINDTTFPLITFINPLEDNTTTAVINETFQFQAVLQDPNLFAYECVIKDPADDIRYNFNDTGLTSISDTVLENIVPDFTGVWTANCTVADDHTKNKLPKYKHSKNNDNLMFNLTGMKNKHEYLIDSISITKIGGSNIKGINLYEEEDRISFEYEFLGSGKKNLKLRVSCQDMHFRGESDYDAHFVCYKAMSWVDFVSDDVVSYTVEKIKDDVYDIDISLKDVRKTKFKSIGGVNILSKEVVFTVTEPAPEAETNTTLINLQCPSSIPGQMSLFMGLFIIAGIIILWFTLSVNIFGYLAGCACVLYSVVLWGCAWYLGLVVLIAGVILFLISLVIDLSGS